jgi:hypothetical protein
MKMVSRLTAERLREMVLYDRETGAFTWKTSRPGPTRAAGQVAGSLSHGYIAISIDGVIHKAHRLAFLYELGAIPELVDHIDGDRANNRWSNLRAATLHINAQNRRKPQRNNSTGFMGVSVHAKTGRFRAVIRFAGRRHSLGLYDTPEAAGNAYLAAKRANHEGCTV